MKQVWVCEDHVTGIFSGIYEAWKAGHTEEEAQIAVKGLMTQELFCVYREAVSKEEKAAAVGRMIVRHMGTEVYRFLYQAVLSPDEEKGNAVFRTMQAARKLGDGRKIMEHLSHPGVHKVFELSRMVGGEAHQFTGFVRFKELANGILFSEITPKSQILTCIADHFSSRLPMENWMIYDRTHEMFLVHKAGQRWFLLHGAKVDTDMLCVYSGRERELARLWRGFVESISIAERENPTLQRQHLPIRYRAQMTEF